MRVGVLGGLERRQRWSQDDKARIVETLIPGAKVTDVARRNGVLANLLHCWHLADVEGPLCANSGPKPTLSVLGHV
jgi:transposase-like protein